MKWIVIVVGVLAAAIFLMYLIGYFMDVKHTASVEHTFEKSSGSEVWKAITTFENYPSWRKDVKKVEVIDPRTWRETTGRNDVIEYQAEKSESEKQFITRIISKDLPFGGSWTFVMTDTTEGIKLTITENGEVYNPLFRFMSRFVFGHDATLKKYMNDLQIHIASPSVTR